MTPMYCVNIFELMFIVKFTRNRNMVNSVANIIIQKSLNDIYTVMYRNLHSPDIAVAKIITEKDTKLKEDPEKDAMLKEMIKKDLNREMILWCMNNGYIEKVCIKISEIEEGSRLYAHHTIGSNRITDKYYYKFVPTRKMNDIEDLIIKNVDLLNVCNSNIKIEFVPERLISGYGMD